jgi:competence protein ComEA
MLWAKRQLDTHWVPLPALGKKAILGLAATVTLLLIVLATAKQESNQVSTSDWLNTGFSSTAPAAAKTHQAQSNNLAALVVVQVVGQVLHPGVYSLKYGSRVIDAVFAAGGFAAHADQASLNLARPVNDGEQLNVQLLGEDTGMSKGAGLENTVNINQADTATLDGLPGIGPTLAQRIIDYRQANGGFRSFDDLGKVAGIGTALLGKLKPLISL